MNKNSTTSVVHQLIAGYINENGFIDSLDIIQCFTIALNGK
tara:strand:+ start:152 stop:274 length:123 start_codon:yes stop_codon:yes gene_type:complete